MLRLRVGLALLLAAGAVPIGIAPAAAAPPASSTICVALVIDARSIGAAVSTDCATVKKGATGIDVLESAGHSVTFRDDGLLCTIDGLPKTGCSAVDDSHYWAYFHRAPGSTTWSYSDQGAGSYQPANDSTEGWVYDDGSKLKPDNVPYAAICKPKASPTPSPKPSASPSAKPTRKVTPHHVAARATTAPALRATARGSHQPRHRHARPRAPAATTPASTPSESVTATAAAVTGSGSSSGGHGTLTGVIVAAVIVAGLGAAALLSNRRRRQL